MGKRFRCCKRRITPHLSCDSRIPACRKGRIPMRTLSARSVGRYPVSLRKGLPIAMLIAFSFRIASHRQPDRRLRSGRGHGAEPSMGRGSGTCGAASEEDPNNTKELNLAGLALIGKGDIEQANEYFRKVLLVSPGFVPALKNLGIDEFNQNSTMPPRSTCSERGGGAAGSDRQFVCWRNRLPGSQVSASG